MQTQDLGYFVYVHASLVLRLHMYPEVFVAENGPIGASRESKLYMYINVRLFTDYCGVDQGVRCYINN